jgi:transposase
MATTQAILQGKDTTAQGELYSSFELGDKQWKITASDGKHNASRYSVDAGDTATLAECLRKAKVRFGLPETAPVHSCYEAGRDGWWLHRWLVEQGIDNIVVDSASIEVNRRARRAKNDRLDGEKLLAMLLRWHAGERRLWSVLRAPTLHAEDARRVERELDRLTHERTAHSNRIGSLLVLHNLRPRRIGGRAWNAWWSAHAQDVPAALRAEIERELERLDLVTQQIKRIEARKRRELADNKQQHPLVTRLSRLRSIGTRSAWKLDTELFGWRCFHNRRQLAASVGLAPTPYDSGGSQVEQGISKAGNKRVRSLLVELAWSWLRYQPDSEMSRWYQRRFAAAGKRMRRVGIVALARRLVIALWRYLQHGEIPAGARLKLAAD